MKKLNEITIADLMPDSISKDAEVSATSRAIDPQLKAISEAVDKPLILASIDELSEGVLEHLAVQYDVTAWNSAWDIDTKRAVLKTAIADKRKMGTRGAVQRAIEAVAPIATITEWWQDTSGDMPAHTFKIDLLQEGSAVDAETQASVIAQVNEAKPVRSHYTFTTIQNAESGLYFAGVLRSIAYARVRSAGISTEQMGIEAGILAAMRGMNIRRLLASSHMGEMPEPTPVDFKEPYGVFAYWGNQLSIPAGYKIAWIKCNVAYTFPKYYTTDGVNVEVYYDGKDVYSDRITAGMIQDPPVNPDSPETYPRVRIYQGDAIGGGYPRMVGLDFSCGDTFSSQGNVVEAAAVNGNDPVHGDYFIYYKAHSYDGTSRYGILANNLPARLFWWDSYVDSGVYAFNLPRSLYSVLNGELQWLGDTTDQQDLAWYYANDWQGQIRFDVYLVGIDEEPGRVDGYFSKDGAFASGDDVISYIYGPDGFPILYDPSKTYSIRKVYMKDGTEVQFSEYAGIYHGMINYGARQYDAIYVHDLSGHAFRIVLDVT